MNAIRIPTLAVTLGTAVAGASYSLVSLATSVVAEGSGLAVGLTGTLVSVGAGMALGPLAGLGIGAFSTLASEHTRHTLRTGGTGVATGVAALAGGATALLVTLGSNIVDRVRGSSGSDAVEAKEEEKAREETNDAYCSSDRLARMRKDPISDPS